MRTTWPANYSDAIMLIAAIEASDSLADAVRTGLISVMTPSPQASSDKVAVRHRLAVLQGTAMTSSGEPVHHSHKHAARVQRIVAETFAVAGISAERKAG